MPWKGRGKGAGEGVWEHGFYFEIKPRALKSSLASPWAPAERCSLHSQSHPWAQQPINPRSCWETAGSGPAAGSGSAGCSRGGGDLGRTRAAPRMRSFPGKLGVVLNGILPALGPSLAALRAVIKHPLWRTLPGPPAAHSPHTGGRAGRAGAAAPSGAQAAIPAETGSPWPPIRSKGGCAPSQAGAAGERQLRVGSARSMPGQDAPNRCPAGKSSCVFTAAPCRSKRIPPHFSEILHRICCSCRVT